jgi:dGTP triphosphohydrolase
VVCDYIAGMTDNYALKCNTQLTQPEPIEFDD